MKPLQTLICMPAVALTLALATTDARAVDGQIDIATLPFTISEPGSYVLVTNLKMDTADENGISILFTSNVTLDLNGHTLAGAGQFAGTNGSGIFVAGEVEGIVIRNGSICDWRLDGIQAPESVRCTIENVTLDRNGGWGIHTGDMSRIEACVVQGCGGGILTGQRGLVVSNRCRGSLLESGIQTAGIDEILNNVCTDNQLAGIRSESTSTVVGNVCMGNNQEGIVVLRRVILQDNVCTHNGADGINALWACTIAGNLCVANGDDGIQAGNDCDIVNNMCLGNARTSSDAAGIRAGAGNTIRGNRSQSGTGGKFGIVLEGGNNALEDNRIAGEEAALAAVPNNRLDIVIDTLPFVISWPGVYRLVGTVSMDDPGSHGITIQSANVTLDLGGHALVGPGVLDHGADSGIFVAAGGYTNVVVRNGCVRGWPNDGIDTTEAEGGRIEQTVCEGNGYNGIEFGRGFHVTRNACNRNANSGIRSHLSGKEEDAIVQENTCTSNEMGISVGSGVMVTGNVCSGNSDIGILVVNGCRVIGNTANKNYTGISGAAGNLIQGNECAENSTNIIMDRHNTVLENNCWGNGISVNGIVSTSAGDSIGNRIEHNSVVGNSVGILLQGAGNYIAANRASGNTTHYSIAPGNTQGTGDLANVSY